MSSRRRAWRERGQVAVEYVGFIPLLLIVALIAIQVGIAGYAMSQASTAARTAARVAGQDDPVADPEAAGKAAISGWLADGTELEGGASGDEATYTATVQIPSLIPVFDFGAATRSSTMPRD
ncbi:TadE/TadG family type IV pilus assembly protein [Streptomyces sp. NPDC051219]|uniref:TadE/TadG family type IV pilus assembly protein n=1 Tax=Streptomyces sp. NPDC051219 TaxID=3155283 RepID=UPI003443815B